MGNGNGIKDAKIQDTQGVRRKREAVEGKYFTGFFFVCNVLRSMLFSPGHRGQGRNHINSSNSIVKEKKHYTHTHTHSAYDRCNSNGRDTFVLT